MYRRLCDMNYLQRDGSAVAAWPTDAVSAIQQAAAASGAARATIDTDSITEAAGSAVRSPAQKSCGTAGSAGSTTHAGDARRAPGPADPAVAEQPATVAAGSPGGVGSAGSPGAAIADQPRGTAGPAADPRRRRGITVAAVAVQQPTRPAIRTRCRPGCSVAD
ncbi:hypothetical protein RN08_2192 [Mycobacterium tuberculosis variant microti]|nr:hypothetical protein RN08_2192 [Mycobacterium tuberculosis variant microti]CNM60013.1 Uncharacterised protein [Mycobacterium tuberculosis]